MSDGGASGPEPGSLPPELREEIDEWIRRSGSRGAEAARMREDLEQHFVDGIASGRSAEELIASFGDPARGAAGFRDAARAPHRGFQPGGDGGLRALQDRIRADLGYAVRTICARPLFAVSVCAVLSLGIAANAVTFTLVSEVLLEPLPVRDQATLVNVLADVPGGNSFTGFSVSDWRDLRGSTDAMTELLATSAVRASFGVPPTDDRVVVSVVSPDYFAALGVEAARGSVGFPSFTDWGADPVVVVSHGFWQRRLAADPDVVGSVLRIADREVTVLGVAAEGFTGTFIGFPTEVWAPLSMIGSYRADFDPEERADKFLELIGRRRAEVAIERAQTELNTVAARIEAVHPDVNRGHRVELVPLTGIDASLRGGVLAFTAVLVIVSLLVLVVTCLNVGSLLLVRAMSREREIAVRLAIGAGVRRLVAQLMTETALVALVATGAALLLTVQATAVLREWIGTVAAGIGLDLDVDWRVLGLTLAVAVFAALTATLAPSLHVLRREPASALRERGPSRPAATGLRAALVTGQVALSVLLAVTSGLFARSLVEGLRIDPGFDADAVASFAVRFDPERYEQGEAAALGRRILDELRAIPGLDGAAFAEGAPVGVARTPTPVVIPGVDPPPGEVSHVMDVRRVGPGYFAAAGIDLVAGRSIEVEDDDGPPAVAVVNRAFAERFFGGAPVVDRTLVVDGAEVRVIGQTVDTRYVLQDATPDPLVYVPRGPGRRAVWTVVFRSAGDPLALVPAVQSRVAALVPGHPPVSVRTVREALSDALLPQRVGAAVVGVMGFVALILAALGLYGLVQFTVTRDMRALGVRLALGGGRRHVLTTVLRRGVLLTAIGVGVGSLAALLIAPGLGPLLPGVPTRDPLTYVGVGTVFVLVSLGASVPAALRASRIDPVVALRAE